MKYVLSTALLCFLFATGIRVNAQGTTEQSSKIALSVYIPQNMEGVTESQKSKLQSKLLQLCANTGFAGTTDGGAGIVIYPKFAIMDKSVVEGMENLTTVKAEITLIIQNTIDNTVFASYTKQVIGTGSSENAARDNAIMRFSPGDKDMQNFIQNGKQKVIDYYNTKCGEILAKVESMVTLKKYQQAVAILFTVPAEASNCYLKVQSKLTSVFQLYSNQTCQTKLTEAKALIANRNYAEGLGVLSEVDPLSSCGTELKSLIQATSAKVNAVDKREWDLKLKMLSTAAEIEKARYNAIANVAGAYFKSQQVNVTVVK